MRNPGTAPDYTVGAFAPISLPFPAAHVPRVPHAGFPESGVLPIRTGGGHMSDDAALVAKAGAGDAVAFRELYTKHRGDVARLVYRMIGARPDSDDVIQEVFFQVHRSLKDFRGKSKFSTWLHRVTVNVVLMHRRAARSRPVYTEETVDDITPDVETVAPDEDADRRQRVRAFSRLLDRLADKKRIVFVLHELEGMAPSEIAQVVGAPVLTVRTRLFYARRELEAMLADEPSLAALKTTFGAGTPAPGETAAELASDPPAALPPSSKRDGAKRDPAKRDAAEQEGDA